MMWLLSQLWVFGLLALVAGALATWFAVVRQRTVRGRPVVDRVHAAHASSGSTKTVGSSLEELGDFGDDDEDEFDEEDHVAARTKIARRREVLGTAIEPRRNTPPPPG